MEKEPWQEDIYDQEESRAERRKRTQGRDVVANRVLTILASIFFVIVVVMIIVLIYLSTGGSNRTAALKDFHDSDASVVQVSSSSSSQPEQSLEPESTSSSSEEATNPEGTIKVLAGEGEAAIAARAGISIAQLEALNPGHMATGSWFANPGDVIKIK
ncbi:SAG1386/EF1546 family surface-associated protein [Streptococcus pneumoniae]|uniref:SAG1386/EF1546 family surface-associated protein n=1 Tax=Streptococcus pneumoniae TaxID=1313 RepID=UPI0005DF18A5|nr:SAG1386/EF1546 family surface-associated protein [Streptococcus pneumoniae]CJP73481.1 30S ribosomal protein S15 [Streptococcus pneumoniae]CKA25300.1 30S ribosomal protein S15 [Streptococcus pneumoniae]CKB40724.1 30S ribosomal protein S15 [Streptococcus pneumoniae]CKB74243.1 30S ribosomal protein S15 [Streptococcus pneumoniae]CKD85661.1 30S ribosomal protein S15 [Streptococcus pneumoniae]